MSDIYVGRLWSRYAALVDSSIERSRGAVLGLKAGTYTPEKYWQDWAAFTGEAIELATVPYDLVFGDLGTPTAARSASLAGTAPFVFSIAQETTGAIDNDLLTYDSGGTPKTIAFTAVPSSDKSSIIVTIASLGSAVAGEEYSADIYVDGDPDQPIVTLTLTITA
jgi:hypothetical protein